MQLSFHSPALSDRDTVRQAASGSKAMENDAAFASIWLLREKYGTEIAFAGGMLLRRYHKGFRKDCYGFPLGGGELKAALCLCAQDAAERGIPLRLTLLTEAQCSLLDTLFPGKFRITPLPDYTEYLYLQENLAALRGSKYHGKRNHIAQFWRSYPDAQIQPLSAENVSFALEIEYDWLNARLEPAEPSVLAELAAIEDACSNWDALGLHGLLLYAGEQPVGMTVVSEISPGVWDVHFEKVRPHYPHAWPVVANEMAKCLPHARYLNREEDLGENGMRASKQSYRPDLLNLKFLAEYTAEVNDLC